MTWWEGMWKRSIFMPFPPHPEKGHWWIGVEEMRKLPPHPVPLPICSSYTSNYPNHHIGGGQPLHYLSSRAITKKKTPSGSHSCRSGLCVPFIISPFSLYPKQDPEQLAKLVENIKKVHQDGGPGITVDDEEEEGEEQPVRAASRAKTPAAAQETLKPQSQQQRRTSSAL